MKIPGILVLLLPFILFGLYIGISEWWIWVNCDTRNHLGMMMKSSQDKMIGSIVSVVTIYIGLLFIVDGMFERYIFTRPFVSIYKMLQKFIAFINKHLTITI